MSTKAATLPEILRKKGYGTYAVGKWHLGFCKKKYLPTNRGFDHHFGFYTGSQDYYNHSTREGYDLRDDLDLVPPIFNDTYSTDLYSKIAGDFIGESMRRQKPFFLYMAFQSVHMPHQVPQKYKNQYNHVKNADRRKHLRMIRPMDAAVARLYDTISAFEILNNTIIIFLSDNGGQTKYGASNYPLRGTKGQIFEGGTRTPAFIWSRDIVPRKEKRMFHITDWFPTLLDAAGVIEK